MSDRPTYIVIVFAYWYIATDLSSLFHILFVQSYIPIFPNCIQTKLAIRVAEYNNYILNAIIVSYKKTYLLEMFEMVYLIILSATNNKCLYF